MRQEIEKKVIQYVAQELGMEEKDIRLDMRLTEDLHADSAILLVLVMDLETEFDIEVREDTLATIRTVNDVVDVIGAALA